MTKALNNQYNIHNFLKVADICIQSFNTWNKEKINNIIYSYVLQFVVYQMPC